MAISRGPFTLFRRWREFVGRSLIDLAPETPWSHTTLWEIEKGTRKVTKGEAELLTHVLRPPIELLFPPEQLREDQEESTNTN